MNISQYFLQILTDLYELTMMQGYFESQANETVIFDVFFRENPNKLADLEMDNPDHIALKYYRSYHSGSAKTLKSIQITLAARLEKFNLESLAALTSADELEIGRAHV